MSLSQRLILLFAIFSLSTGQEDATDFPIEVGEEDDPLSTDINVNSTLGDRSLLVADVQHMIRRLKIFKTMEPCIDSYLQVNLQFPEYVPVVLPTDEAALRRMSYIVRDMQEEIGSFILNGKLDPYAAYNSSNNALIVIESSAQLPDDTNLIALCSKFCDFTIFLVHLFYDTGSFIEEADALILKLWRMQIAQVTVLSLVNDTIVAADSVAFEPDMPCQPAPPSIVGRCENDTWIDLKPREMLLMNSCVVNVAYFVADPYVQVLNNESDRLSGIEGELMEALAQSMNFTLQRTELPWPNDSDLFYVAKSVIMESDIDFVLGGLYWRLDDLLVYTWPYESVTVGWVLPVFVKVSFNGLIKPLQADVWLLVIVTLLIAYAIRIVFMQHITMLDTVGLIIGIPVEQPTKIYQRVWFITWAIFGFLLTNFYVASLANQLLQTDYDIVKTLQDLDESDLLPAGTANHKDLLVIDDEDEDQEEDIVIESLTKKFVELDVDDYLMQLSQLETGENTSLALVLTTNVSSFKHKLDPDHVYQMEKPLAKYPLGLATWRGIPYLEKVDSAISHLNEGGFVALWAERYSYRKRSQRVTDDDGDVKLLRFRNLIPAFLLLVIGHLLGAFVLLIEIIVHPSKYFG